MLGPYRALLTLPGAPRLVSSSIVGRIPYGMENFGILLFVEDVTGSYASAGAVAAASAAAVCVGGPAQGRIIDRVGQPPVLLACGVIHLLALAALVALGLGGAPVWALIGLAVLAGAFVPPLSPALRTLWPGLVARAKADRAVLDTAYAFEAVAIEVLFVLGPLLAAVLIALASPAACVLAGGVLALAGSAGFATAQASRTWRAGATDDRHWLGPLRSRSVLVLVAVAVPHGAAVGLIEFGIPAWADRHGAPELAGVVIACWAAGSLAGGLVYGSRRHRTPARRRLVLLHLALAVAVAPLAFADGFLVLSLLVVLAGLPLASAAACLYALLAEVVPAGAETEANTWLISGIVAGIAIGGLLSGFLIEGPGPEAAFAASIAIFVLAAGTAQAGRGALLGRAPAPVPT